MQLLEYDKDLIQNNNNTISSTSPLSNSSSISTSNNSPIIYSVPLVLTKKYALIRENLIDPKYKTELCKTFSETGICPYGDKCRFAHGKEELFNKIITCKMYKQKNCNSFYNNYYCNYGSRCHFKHDERKYWEINKTYYTKLLMILGSIGEHEIEEMSIDEMINYISKISRNDLQRKQSRFNFDG